MDLPPDDAAGAAADRAPFRAELIQAQKIDALGQLVSGIEHDLNNGLAAILAFSKLIGRDVRVPDDVRRDADLLVDEADRIRRLLGSLLDFARRRQPERHPTPLHALISSVLELEAYLLTSNRVSVDVDIPPDLPALPLDRAQMQQVFLNLTLSALEGIRSRQEVDDASGGRIEIRASASAELDDGPSTIRVAVTHDGAGVPPEYLSQLFDPSATQGAPLDGGALRLPVSQAIVAAHGGQLRYEPSPTGDGETFIVELPLPGVRAASADRASPRQTRSAADTGDRDSGIAAGRSGRGPGEAGAATHVLVVDDEPAIRRFLTRALEIAGFAPIAAEDGESAIEIARETMFDAAVCDHRMAGLTGTDAYAALVELQPHLARRFVLMSGDVLNPALREFAETRGLALLAKPFDVETVGRTVRAVIAQDEVQSRG